MFLLISIWYTISDGHGLIVFISIEYGGFFFLVIKICAFYHYMMPEQEKLSFLANRSIFAANVDIVNYDGPLNSF